MIIIPAIDVMDGEAVRLTGGNYQEKKVYYKDCLDAALAFEDAGFIRLHLVDLDGAKNKQVTNLAALERIATHTKLKIDFGGGIKTRENVLSVFDAGAYQCVVSSLAVEKPKTLSHWIQEFGSGKFLIGADVLHDQIKISGWLEDSGLSLFDFIDSMRKLGLSEFFCTDISKDGKLAGPAVDLYKNILSRYADIELIASGGVVHLQDLEELKQAGCSGAIVGKAIYEKTISLKELSEFK